MTRLEKLVKIHNQQGGTIHQFNNQYQVDFLHMNEDEFTLWMLNIEFKLTKSKSSYDAITAFIESK